MSKLKAVKKTKWDDSTYYSNGYKLSGKNFGNSSFWMDDDFINDDPTTSTTKTDVVKLAGYKRAIGNFVRIVTGKDDIKVNFSAGKHSYTDGNTVVISAKLDEKEFDSTVGLALHEGSHIALTNFKTLERMYKSTELNYIFEKHQDTITQDEFCNKIKTLVNIIEDRRIDKFVYDSAPGYQGYYQSLYDRYFNAKEIDNALLNSTMTEENWDCYEFHICNFANPNRQLNSLSALRRIWNLINLPNISRLKSTDDVFDVAVQVYCTIHEAIGWVYTPTVTTAAQPTAGKDEEGKGSETQMAEGSDSNDNGEDDNLDVPTGGAQASQKPSKEEAKAEKEKKALDKAIAKQKQFLDGDISKKNLSRKEADQVNAASESNMEYAEVGGSIEGYGNKGTVNCMVVRGINRALVDSGLLRDHWTNPEQRKSVIARYSFEKDYVREGINLGIMLGKRLKTRDEDRSLKTTRMETGRIDRRLISELGFGNDKVFSQIVHNTVTPSLIHISIDASGSMSGKKWQSSMKTAVAIAKAASMISSLDCVISLRGSFSHSTPLMWIVYDSRKDSFASAINTFYGLECGGSTPEGLCYQAVMKEIIASANGKEAFLINLCDGEPGFGAYGGYWYGGDYAIEHTRIQVEKMRKSGIKILGYYISDYVSDYESRSQIAFKKMYGKDSEFIDVSSLTQLSISLNKMLERK